MRKLLFILVILVIVLSLQASCLAETVTYAFVATWQETTPWLPDHGDGIDVYRVNEDGTFTQTCNFPTETNSTILAVSPDGQNVYATDETRNYDGEEGMGGGVIAMAFDPETGTLTRLNKLPSVGAAPSNVHIDPTGTLVAVSNHGSTVGSYYAVKAVQTEEGKWVIEKEYDDSSVCVYCVNEDGSLNEDSQALYLTNVNGAHLHTVRFSPSGKWMLSCDKGTGKIFVYKVDIENSIIEPADIPFIEQPDGHPRHLEFDPNNSSRFYVIHERGLNIASYDLDEETGVITPLDFRPSCSGDEVCIDGVGAGSDIHVHANGKFVYCSNRRANGDAFEGNIGVFSVDEEGKLSLIQCVGVGPNPRGYGIDTESKYLYVCNAKDYNNVRYVIDPETGKLSDPLEATVVGTPTCIQFKTYEVA